MIKGLWMHQSRRMRWGRSLSRIRVAGTLSRHDTHSCTPMRMAIMGGQSDIMQVRASAHGLWACPTTCCLRPPQRSNPGSARRRFPGRPPSLASTAIQPYLENDLRGLEPRPRPCSPLVGVCGTSHVGNPRSSFCNLVSSQKFLRCKAMRAVQEPMEACLPERRPPSGEAS